MSSGSKGGPLYWCVLKQRWRRLRPPPPWPWRPLRLGGAVGVAAGGGGRDLQVGNLICVGSLLPGLVCNSMVHSRRDG